MLPQPVTANPHRRCKSSSLPQLTIRIPRKHDEHSGGVIDMATSHDSPRAPLKKTPASHAKRVSFSNEEPEVIPPVSKRRQSSVNQRPSWSNVFLLREPKVRDDAVARSRSLSPGPSILKEFSAFNSNASDAKLKQDADGIERKVHVSPLWEKNLKRLPRGRHGKKHALPIPQAKVSRNVNPRAPSPERDVSPTNMATLSARHASPREDAFKKTPSERHSIVVHPPSPPQSDAEDDDDDEDEDAIEDSDESPKHSRNSSFDDVEAEAEAIDSKFSKCNIDASSHAQRHEKQRNDSLDDPKASQRSRKSSDGSRKSSTASRKDSQDSSKDTQKPPTPRRRSSSADQAEKWLRKSSIYGVRSRTPRVPTRLGSLRA